MHISITLVLYSLVAQAVLAAPEADQSCSLNKWKWFKEKFSKRYNENQAEDRLRLSIFCKNLQQILEHNSNPNATYTQAVNHFSDMTAEEIDKIVPSLDQEDQNSLMNSMNLVDSPRFLSEIVADINEEPPAEVDWSLDPKRVASARSQGECGSCWAFTIVAMLEGQEKPTGNDSLVELSEQNLVDCDKLNFGCQGGSLLNALKSIKRNGGVMTRADYPYISGETKTRGRCRMDADMAYKTTIDLGEASVLTVGNETLLKQVVSWYGPIAIAIRATKNFLRYNDGVFYEEDCDGPPNHGVTLVGYGKDKRSGRDYWKIKNSWSEKWGINGFGLMSRNRHNNCRVASSAVIIKPHKDDGHKL